MEKLRVEDFQRLIETNDPAMIERLTVSNEVGDDNTGSAIAFNPEDEIDNWHFSLVPSCKLVYRAATR